MTFRIDEKMPWHEIASDFIKMLESLKPNEIKMALGAVAGNFDLGVVSNKPSTSGSGFKPYPKRR